MTQHQNEEEGKSDITESDVSQEENEKANEKAVAEVIENSTFNFSLFKAFMDWQCKNQLGDPPIAAAAEECPGTNMNEILMPIEQPETVPSYGNGKTGFIDTINVGCQDVAQTDCRQVPDCTVLNNFEGVQLSAGDPEPVVMVHEDGKMVSMSEKTADALTTENLSQEQLQLQAQRDQQQKLFQQLLPSDRIETTQHHLKSSSTFQTNIPSLNMGQQRVRPAMDSSNHIQTESSSLMADHIKRPVVAVAPHLQHLSPVLQA